MFDPSTSNPMPLDGRTRPSELRDTADVERGKPGHDETSALPGLGLRSILRTRRSCAATSAVLGTLLVVASALSPDSRGLGTHEQLGLGPCTFATVVGKRCPTCGMTTAWCHLTHGEFAAAVKTHTCGSLLGMMAGAAAGIGMGISVFGTKRFRFPSERILLAGTVIFVTGMLGEWLIRLALQEWGGRF
jgi:hypothetical protein